MKYALPLLLLTLAGCAAQPTVKSWLDPVSSATITAQLDPLVLARAEPAQQPSQRDYAQLAAIEVNRMGDRHLYLVAILWSTAESSRSQKQTFEDSFSQIEVQLNDRAVALKRHSGDISELGIGQAPLPMPIEGSYHAFYPIERADLKALAQSNRVEIKALGVPETPHRYEEWKDGRQSLNDFLGQLPEARPQEPTG